MNSIRPALIAILMFMTFPVFATQELKIAVSITNSSQRAAYYNLIRSFEKAHPDTRVTLTSFTSEIYKSKFPQMLASKKYDVLYWHAGERLFRFVDKGEIASLNEIFTSKELAGMYDNAVINSISINKDTYALPMSYYQIGFYYNKPLFTKLGISEPHSWEEFVVVCEALKQNNVSPIYIGTKSNWPATAWFDYINLRLNGLDFHMSVVRGEASFLDPRITNVLKKIQSLSTAEYFIKDHHELEWKQGLPLLFRGLTGMSMLGNYAIQDFPGKIIDKIGFFKFPLLNHASDYYEEAPLDVLVIPTNTEPSSLAKLFIRFASRSDMQAAFNKTLGVLSPHKNAQLNNSPLVHEAYNTITNARGITQYFDRDGKEDYVNKVMPLLDEFMTTLDIAATQKALEAARKSTQTQTQTQTQLEN